MLRLQTMQARTLTAVLLIAVGVGVLVHDLDNVPLAALALALCAFVAGATLLARPAR